MDFSFAWLADPQAWIALGTLTVLEIVLGIDNIIFISILAGKLPAEQQAKARQIGLVLALVTRILLLFSLSILAQLTDPLFTIMEHGVSGRDLILGLGGLFLLGKATVEIHEKIEGGGHKPGEGGKAGVSFNSVLVQIMLLDIVFSIDSVITAVGMVKQLEIMVIAVVIAVIVMLVFVNAISEFVDRHPTVKVLALSFLLMIGLTLIGESLHFHIPKGYIYFAMAFSVMVEMINLRVKANAKKSA
ncbi:TerC family protein [Acanthopleuribacter pedis]|uniref:TerC family protein n=1 Tax=Acanthopleuribacter pedis TaxID=442870 RepID=A0A8J7U140_9BACT|nr:TerC family protein [Acanthopleuribacter pedis]MBO1317147.1 TerC family protein [Acanthopleuribacter pedis]